MGRIQRKKTDQKKKRQSGEPLPVSQVETEAAETKTASAPAAVRDVTQRKSFSPKKQLVAGKSLPGKNFIDKWLQYLREVKIELKKVTWPTRKQTIGSTAVVIVLVVIISFFLGIVDIGLSGLIRVVLQ